MEPLTPEKAYRWATTLCARGEHCSHEMMDKARRKGLPQDECQQLVDRLTDEGYISDQRYCRAFVNDKFRFDGWGRIKIRAALRLNHIPEADISTAIDELISEDDYLALLQRTIERKARQTDDRQKIMRHAASRGFEPHLIMDALMV